MTTTQPAPQQRSRSNAALAALLLLGNLFFWGCVASRFTMAPTGWSEMAAQPERIVLAEG